MTQQFLPLVLLQLYWFSIAFIGWSVLRRLREKSGWTALRTLPFLANFLLSNALGFGLVGVVTVLGYALHLPITVLVAVYAGALVAAVISVNGNHLSFGRPSKLLLFVSFVLLGGLIFDYFLSLWIGGYLGGDAIVHISKIRWIVEHGFSLTDAYFGTVPETRHHIGVTHSLYAIPTWFGMEAWTAWFGSQAYFRLLLWASLFLLSWMMLGHTTRKVRLTLSTVLTIAGILLLSGSYTAQYPTTYSACWVVVFVAGLMYLIRRQVKVGSALLLLASFLIALTHPLTAVAAAFLLAFVCLGTLVFDRRAITRGSIGAVIGSGALLLSTPLFTQLLPNRMTETARNYGLERYEFFHVGDFFARVPTLPQGPLEWSLLILSFIGGLYLFLKARKRAEKVIVVCLGLFAVLVLYNPLVYTLASKVLPAWAINRFGMVGQLFSIIAVPIGIFWIATGILRFTRLKGVRREGVALGLLTAVVLIFSPLVQSFNTASFVKGVSVRKINYNARQLMGAYKNILKDVPDGTVVFAGRGDSFFLPAVAPVHVIAISEANATPAADMTHRTKCFESLYATLDPLLLKQARVEYILTQRGSAFDKRVASMASLVKKDSSSWTKLALYKVSVPTGASSDNSCLFDEN